MFIYDEATRESLDNIFGAILVGAIDRNDAKKIEAKKSILSVCTNRFLGAFAYNIFTNEYAVLYELFKVRKVRVFSLDQMRDIVRRSGDIVLNSPNVDLAGKYEIATEGRAATDDEKLEAFMSELEEKFIELSNRVVSEEEFNSSLVLFIDKYKDTKIYQIAQDMTMIMSDTGQEIRGKRGRKTIYKGAEDAQRYYTQQMEILRGLSDQGRTNSVVIDIEYVTEDIKKDSEESNDGILDTGLEEIDSVTGEWRRSNLVTILGPTKGGKTRFTNYLVDRALERGLNVCVWPLEGTKEEWIANQVACYIRRTSGLKLDSKNILRRKYETDDNRVLVQATKTVIAEGKNRGRLSFLGGTAYIEDFLDVMKAHYTSENPFDIIVIDQLINVLSRTGRQKVDRISSAYMETKDFITNQLPIPAIALIPAQLKQDVVNHLRKNPEDTIDITAGGESAEVIRSADEVLGIFSSKDERAANLTKFYSVASRHSENFPDFLCRAELGCCYFSSDNNLNM